MTAADRTDFIIELTRDIAREAIAPDRGSPDGQAIKADLNTLAEQLIEAMVNRRDEVVAKAYEAVERAFSEIATKCDLDKQAFDALATATELRALTRFLGAAVQYRQAPQAAEVVRQGTYQPLLLKLRGAANGLSSGDLALALREDPATVARKLPYLRSVGLVRSQQVGRQMINRLTDEAHRQLVQLQVEQAPLEAAVAAAAEEAHKQLDQLQAQASVEAAAAVAAAAIGDGGPAPQNPGLPNMGAAMGRLGVGSDVIAKRAAMVSDTSMKIGRPVGVRIGRQANAPDDLTIEHGRVAADAAMTVEIRATGDVPKQHVLSMAKVILREPAFVGLCRINRQVTDNLDIHFRGDRIFANIGVKSVEDDKGLAVQGA
jgi:hypothetical protein